MPRSRQREARADAEETGSFPLRGQLIDAIRARIDRLGLSQAEAARQLGITAPRLNLLMHGRAEFFSVDALVNLAVRLGLNVRLRITRPYVSN